MANRNAVRYARSIVATIALALVCSASLADDPNALREGSIITLTREAVVNGVTLTKGSQLRVSSIKKDATGSVRLDLEQVGGAHQTFKSLTPDAVAQMTGAANSAVPNGDPGQMFKPGAQIPLVRDLTLQGTEFHKGSTLQVDKVVHDAKGKVVKIDLRETGGKLRLLKGVPVEQILLGLAGDAVTWPDGVVGARLQLPKDLQLGDTVFPKGTKFVVTHVVHAASGAGVVKVSLREADGQKRSVDDVSVAVLKQGGALGTAEGAPK